MLPCLPPSTAKKAGKEGEEKPAEDAGAEADGGNGFTLFVEQEKPDSSWKVLEAIKEVQLQEMAVDGEKKVQVAYKNNKVFQTR